MATNASAQKGKFNVYFATSEFNISRQQAARLDSFAGFVKSNRIASISLSGHTDNQASETFNQKLSESRVTMVVEYLTAAGVNPAVFTERKAVGLAQPTASNASTEGRRLNRRVEITYSLAPAETTAIVQPEDLEALKRKKDSIENLPVVKVFPGGTVITIPRCAFEPMPVSKLQIDVTELYSEEEISRSTITTLSRNGDCLASGGMVVIKVSYAGQMLTPKCPVSIAMPTDNIDTAMRLYQSELNRVDNQPWALADKPQVNYDSTGNTAASIPDQYKNGRYRMASAYYTFSTMTLGGINMDKVQGLYAKFKPKRWRGSPTYVFKIPKSVENNVVIQGKDGLHKIETERINGRLFFFPPKCLSITAVTAYYHKNEVRMTCTRPIAQLRYNPLTNRYKFKKKWFVHDTSYRMRTSTM